MSEILKSVTKIVLLMLTTVLAIAYLFAIVKAVMSGQQVLDQIPFKEIILLVAGFFFAYKGDGNQPYAGK